MRRLVALETINPLIEMNTTPLIDVLLVLLVMLIITIPIQTHAVKLDLPTCVGCPVPKGDVNVVTIDTAGRISWNGTPVSKRDLGALLHQTQQMRPTPELHLRPDARASYGTVDEVLGIVKRAHIEKFGFIGNEAYSSL